MKGYAVFFLDQEGEIEYGPWWTAWVDEWPFIGESADEVVARVRKRFKESTLEEEPEFFVAVPFDNWIPK